ncbi:hypothetical protein E5676_scaffold109G00420 [Cucumis melo var. makuwa]|uniref:Uncharacterized protein n=1 Tax=Cucumis melo var. makuwa TaxID=1194695 RepID=A0A5D3BQ28_CUCMM|nr:hypothetical protein E6C27_scaffold83G00380 [Cucumis melo var. makuwa]TYK01160.1 hypothetical protein E5676_scaffold109G00420 [Cucumis melo var. makuwa]
MPKRRLHSTAAVGRRTFPRTVLRSQLRVSVVVYAVPSVAVARQISSLHLQPHLPFQRAASSPSRAAPAFPAEPCLPFQPSRPANYEPPACFGSFSPVLESLDRSVGFLQLRAQALQLRPRDCAVRRDRQSGIDIDMIQVIQWDRSQPDCLSVSSGYTTDQFVLSVPFGFIEDQLCSSGITCCTCSGTCQFLGAEVRAKASWRATKSDRGEP